MSQPRILAAVAVATAGWALVVPVVGTAHAATDLHGTIAVAPMRVGAAVDYPTQYEADQAALDACGDPTCYIVTRIRNECGSVVERDIRSPFGHQPSYHTGTGATAADAEQNAMSNAGPGHILPPFEISRPAFVLDTICTSNAG